jgi:mono-ADP-ribosyltransferase sirtuin 6
MYLANYGTLHNTPDFRAVADYTQSVHDHRTGRKCTRCGGTLHDTIINFSEPLPERELTLACEHASKADLCLVLGSSLTVTPANEIPEMVGKRRRRGAKLVICNLQATPLDGMAELRVYAKTDELMVRVMRELELEIPAFVLERRLGVTVERPGQKMRVRVEGVDVDGTPVSFLRSVRLANNRRVLKAEPFVFDLKGNAADEGLGLTLDLGFMGHYGEPNLELVHEVREEEREGPVVYLLQYNPSNGEWKTGRL